MGTSDRLRSKDNVSGPVGEAGLSFSVKSGILGEYLAGSSATAMLMNRFFGRRCFTMTAWSADCNIIVMRAVRKSICCRMNILAARSLDVNGRVSVIIAHEAILGLTPPIIGHHHQLADSPTKAIGLEQRLCPLEKWT
jgi:hypothetical protein